MSYDFQTEPDSVLSHDGLHTFAIRLVQFFNFAFSGGAKKPVARARNAA
jgi:hypothetical protein